MPKLKFGKINLTIYNNYFRKLNIFEKISQLTPNFRKNWYLHPETPKTSLFCIYANFFTKIGKITTTSVKVGKGSPPLWPSLPLELSKSYAYCKSGNMHSIYSNRWSMTIKEYITSAPYMQNRTNNWAQNVHMLNSDKLADIRGHFTWSVYVLKNAFGEKLI